LSSASRPTRALLSRGALLHNVRLLRGHVKTPLMAVVKAEAYGHAASLLAPLLQKAGLNSFGVATLEEGLRLRQKGIRGEVMILGAMDERHLGLAARHQIGITAWNRLYLKAASRFNLNVHLKADTGMIRLGFMPSEIPGVLADFESGRFGRLKLSSAYTHFACADEPGDRASLGQLRAFLGLPWPKGLRLHAANSAAALRYPQARLGMVRSGIFLYGAQEPIHPLVKRSRPVLAFKTSIVRVAEIKKGQGVSYGHTFKAPKAMRVATLCAGYADGVPRLLSKRGSVLVGGKRCRILGRVCMDLMMADVSAVRQAKPGDEAVLIGRQGNERITANEWARLCQTNTYEILCGISARVPRELAA
jgi:alanine racemase